MRKVYSLALFDADATDLRGRHFYWHFLPGFLRGFFSCFPGWELWIYHDETIYDSPHGDDLFRLANAGKLRLIYVPRPAGRCEGMLWRMKPLWEGADIVACRDVDGLPYPREYKTVEDWIREQIHTFLHVIWDSESHSGIMGGTSTWRATAFREKCKAATWSEFLAGAATAGIDLTQHGADQVYLNHLFKKERWDYTQFPEHVDRRDKIGPHIGAGFASNLICDWYDRNEPAAVRDVRAAEIAFSPVRVVMGSDQHPQYVGGLPLTALMWREVCRYRPLYLLVGSDKEWLSNTRTKFICDKIREVGGEIRWIGQAQGHRPATMAQVARLYAALLPGIDSQDFLITSDADMWPLSAKWFAQRRPGMVTLWYANAYEDKFPLCYVGATADQWREIMHCDSSRFDDIVQARLDKELGRQAEGMTAWCFDEQHFGTYIKKWDHYPGDCMKVNRHGGPPKDRIDRSCWPDKPDVTGMVDAHLVRPVENKYPQVRPLLDQTLSPDLLRWCDDYVRDLARL